MAKNIIIISMLVFGIISCTTNGLRGKYKSYWYETYHELTLKTNNRFVYKSEGHLGIGEYKGKYEIFNDTLILNGEVIETGINKFLITKDKCLIELETRFDYCRHSRDTFSTYKRDINYPQLKEKNLAEKQDVINMLQIALTNPKLEKYFEDTTKKLVVQEYYEIKQKNNIQLLYLGKPIKLMSKSKIEEEKIKEYLIIDEINIGLNSAMIDFQVMPEFSIGVLDFFYKEGGKNREWKLKERTL